MGSEFKTDGFETGRIIAEHKELYIVRTDLGEIEAEVTGNIRFTAKGREDFLPWRPVTLKYMILFWYNLRDTSKVILIKKESVGKQSDIQIIGANIDYCTAVQAVDRISILTGWSATDNMQ